MAHIVAAHGQTRHLIETVFYPEHGPERTSETYRNAHHRLVYELDEACWICGVRNSTLTDPVQNPHGAAQMETHHDEVEAALANSIDPATLLRDFPAMGAADSKHLRRWLDGEGNLLVLCDVHHRHGLYGIHLISYPAWKPQRWQFKGWDLATGPVTASAKEN
jgi:hypothetical protein